MRITEDYCSFETAKLLKEKGFDAPCLQVYTSDGKRYNMHSTCYQNVCDDDECLAPTLQMACKWLREEHNLHIDVNIYNDYSQDADGRIVDEWVYWSWRIYNSADGYAEAAPPTGDGDCFDTYEEALEAGCLYALKNLI